MYPVDSHPDLTAPDRVTRLLGDTSSDERTLDGSARLAWFGAVPNGRVTQLFVLLVGRCSCAVSVGKANC